MNKPKAVIVDIDGTIAFHGNRNVYDFEKVLEDVPRPNVIQWIKDCITDDTHIVYLTGRDDSCYDDTVSWLAENVNKYFPNNSKTYLMRRTGDWRSSPITKKELFDLYVEPHYDTLFAVDDMMKNCIMWKYECGIRSFFVKHDDDHSVGNEEISEII